MYKFINTVTKTLQTCRTTRHSYILKRHNNASLGLQKTNKYKFVYLFSGLTFAGCVAYKANVKCDQEISYSDDIPHEDRKPTALTKPEKWTLYQYATCPFCCKVRAFLDYYGIEYEKVEVNPVNRKEIKFQEYRKVPFVRSGDTQINDSSLIISVLKGNFLGKGDIQTLVSYYPFLESEDGKGKGEYANVYNVMYQQGFSHSQNLAIREESKWRRWIDESFVHTLSPNIYRTIGESLQAMEYITKVGNFSDREQKIVYYTGALAMYFVGKRVAWKHHLRKDVRQSMYEEANKWVHNVGSKKPFMGGKQPNIADLNMYGVISAIDGLPAFDDLMKNTKIEPWYKRMKAEVNSHNGKKDPDWLTLR